MVAAPQYSTFTLKGRSGKSYSVDAYSSDVLAALINLDGGAGASSSSPTYWSAPEDCILVDWSVVTGLTDTTKLQLTRNQVPTGDFLRAAIHLTSLNNRPALRIGFRRGDQLGGIQR